MADRMIELLKIYDEIKKESGQVEPLEYDKEFFCSIE